MTWSSTLGLAVPVAPGCSAMVGAPRGTKRVGGGEDSVGMAAWLQDVPEL
jgi:hypothetical protein